MFLDVIAYTCVWEHIQVVLGRTSPHIHVTWGGYLQAGSWEHVTPAWRDHLDGQGCYPQAARTQGSKDGRCKALSKSRQARMGTSPHIRDTWCTTFGAHPRIYVSRGAPPWVGVHAYIGPGSASPYICVTWGAALGGHSGCCPECARPSAEISNGWRPKVSRRVSSRELCVSSGCPGVTQEPFRCSRGRLPPRPRISV